MATCHRMVKISEKANFVNNMEEVGFSCIADGNRTKIYKTISYNIKYE